jgi:excisionase family DNA binding protein
MSLRAPAPVQRPPGAPWPFREAAPYLGVSVPHLIRMADRNLVRTIRIGRRRLLPAWEVERLATDGTT